MESMTLLFCAVALVGLQACERPAAQMVSAPSMRPPSQERAVIQHAAELEAPAANTDLKPSPRFEPLPDTAITARIEASLMRDPALAGSDISVNTDSGVVNLTGTVRSHEQLALAASHAQRQDGVMRIESHLALVNS